MSAKEAKRNELDGLDEDQQEQLQILRAVLGTVQHYFGGIEQMFEGVADPRSSALIDYPLAALFFTGIFMFLTQLGARRGSAAANKT